MKKNETRITLNEIISEYINSKEVNNINIEQVIEDLPSYISRYHKLGKQFSEFLNYLDIGYTRFIEIGKNGLTSIAPTLEKNGKNICVVTRHIDSFQATCNDFPCYVGGISDDGDIFISKNGHTCLLNTLENDVILIHGMSILNNNNYTINKLIPLILNNYNVVIGCYNDELDSIKEIETLKHDIYNITNIDGKISTTIIDNNKIAILVYSTKTLTKNKVR